MSALPQEVSLRPMEAGDRAAWSAASQREYVRDRVRAGEPEEVAQAVAAQQYDQFFPGGEPAPGHETFVVEAAGRRIGIAWIGPNPQRPDDDASGWLYDIELDESARGQGFGRAALAAVERHAAAIGRRNFGLNVFGHNTVARALYASAGYRETAVLMSKELEPDGPAGTGAP